MFDKVLNIIKKYKKKDISFDYYTDNTNELEKLPKDNSFVGTKGWAVEGYYDDSKYISCCENAKNDILNKIEVKALIRVKANLYTYAGTQIEHGFHRDQTYSHKGAILTINSNNGYTLFKDGTKIESIENRLLLFDPSEEHSSATCTDSAKRINININYF